MPMMTGDAYKESLKDGRLTYIDGDQVTDPANHPLLKTAVDVAARVYDSFHSRGPRRVQPGVHHSEVARRVSRARQTNCRRASPT